MKPKIDIEYVSRLARLKLTKEELSKFSAQLGDILSYISKLNQVDTSDVPSTSHVLNLKNVFREDVVKLSLDASDVLDNAPDVSDGFFRVPRIIEEA